MCRLLCIQSAEPFEVSAHLQTFAALARDSTEYQGHGWGCAWVDGDTWRLYHNINPIWEDALPRISKTRLLLAHARSAFRDEGICVENNMPFYDGTYVFIFNGELRGVRIKEQGRIGAEKVFNYIKRFDKGDMQRAIQKGLEVIDKRTRYVRALNCIVASKDAAYAACRFNESPGYFQLREKRSAHTHLVCSDPYPGETGWHAIANGSVCRLNPGDPTPCT